MKNVARTKFRNDYKTATFPGDVRLSYVDTLTKVGDDELVEAIDLTFVPGHDERVALAHGGFVQVVMPGVTSPPQIALNVIDSTETLRSVAEMDTLVRIARTFWENQQPPPSQLWEEIPIETQRVMLQRADSAARIVLATLSDKEG